MHEDRALLEVMARTLFAKRTFGSVTDGWDHWATLRANEKTWWAQEAVRLTKQAGDAHLAEPGRRRLKLL